MPSMFDAATRLRFQRRIETLTPQSERLWGTLSPERMVCHLSDQVRLALGELPTRRGSGPMSFPPIRWLVIDVVTWPHGTKGPPEAFKTQPAVWSRDVASLGALLERFATLAGQRDWPDHPLFGRMSGPLWGRLTCKHFDHHLRQFGV